MKYTLLEMTQDVLSNMSSDEVNSIGDTVESLQVARIIKQKYFDVINRLNLIEHEQLLQLNPSLDDTSPVIMYVPEGVSNIKWLKYFNSNTSSAVNLAESTDINDEINGITPTSSSSGISPPGYAYVTLLPIEQFIEMVNRFDPSVDNVESFTFSDTSNGFNKSFTFYYKNDSQPCYATIISNYYVIFDSYDNTVDDTLQGSKTMFMGSVIPTFRMEDSFIPDLAEEQFPLLLSEAKSLAFYELKQQPHQLAMQESKRGWSTIQKKKNIDNVPSDFDQLPDFGRKGNYMRQPFLGGVYSW